MLNSVNIIHTPEERERGWGDGDVELLCLGKECEKVEEETKKLLKCIQAEQEQMKQYVFRQMISQGSVIDRVQIFSYVALAVGALNFVLLWIV